MNTLDSYTGISVGIMPRFISNEFDNPIELSQFASGRSIRSTLLKRDYIIGWNRLEGTISTSGSGVFPESLVDLTYENLPLCAHVIKKIDDDLFGRLTCHPFSSSTDTYPTIFVIPNSEGYTSENFGLERSLSLDDELCYLLDQAKSESFDDNALDEFENKFGVFIHKYLAKAITSLLIYIISGSLPTSVVHAILTIVGRISDPETHSARLWLLEHCLNLSSQKIRDGAGLGLSYLDDPAAIPYINNAITKESNPLLRNNLRLVLIQLERTRLGHLSIQNQARELGI